MAVGLLGVRQLSVTTQLTCRVPLDREAGTLIDYCSRSVHGTRLTPELASPIHQLQSCRDVGITQPARIASCACLHIRLCLSEDTGYLDACQRFRSTEALLNCE